MSMGSSETALGKPVERELEAPRFDPQRALAIQDEIRLFQEIVRDVLKPGVDYGSVPGIPGEFLWQSGASIITSSYSCYAGERRILSLVDDADKIAVCVEVPLVSYATGKTVATGVGAASTLETRHKYRWVEDPSEWGYHEESIKTLKTKREGGQTRYRITNPEHGELLHNLLKQASKRGEVDAAQNLPGVATMLKELLSSQGNGQGRRQDQWTRFWAEVRRLGYSQEEAHQRLKVTSMKQWQSGGHSLEDALAILRRRSESVRVGQSRSESEEPEPTDAEEQGEAPLDTALPRPVPKGNILLRLTEARERVGWNQKQVEDWLLANANYLKPWRELTLEQQEQAIEDLNKMVEGNDEV
jgi:hypothetical protein